MISIAATMPCSDTERPRLRGGASFECGVGADLAARCVMSAGWLPAAEAAKRGTSVPFAGARRGFGASPVSTKQALSTGARAWSPPV